MRRFPRHVFTIISALSVLLCVATAALWIRSYWNGYEVCYHRGERLYEARMTCGSFFASASWYPAVDKSWAFYSDPVDIMRADRLWLPRLEAVQEGWQAAVPGWIICGMCVLLSVSVAYRRGRTSRGDHCRTCGYDLRASPERCPECGTANSRAV